MLKLASYPNTNLFVNGIHKLAAVTFSFAESHFKARAHLPKSKTDSPTIHLLVFFQHGLILLWLL